MKQYTIPSSKGGDGYVVTLDGPDGNECGCKAFEYSTTDPRHCKHISAARREDSQLEAARRAMEFRKQGQADEKSE